MLVAHGYSVLLPVLSLILVSPWLLELADNVGLFIGVLYLPLVALSYVFQLKRRKFIFPTSFLAMLVTLLLGGAEFISAVACMAFLPVVYYSVLNHDSLRNAARDGATIAAGLVLAGTVAAGVLWIQLAQVMPAESFLITSPTLLSDDPSVIQKNGQETTGEH